MAFKRDQPTYLYEAYLGPARTETIATGRSHKKDAPFAVVAQKTGTEETRLVGVFYNEGIATRLAKNITRKEQFGILCEARMVTA